MRPTRRRLPYCGDREAYNAIPNANIYIAVSNSQNSLFWRRLVVSLRLPPCTVRPRPRLATHHSAAIIGGARNRIASLSPSGAAAGRTIVSAFSPYLITPRPQPTSPPTRLSVGGSFAWAHCAAKSFDYSSLLAPCGSKPMREAELSPDYETKWPAATERIASSFVLLRPADRRE